MDNLGQFLKNHSRNPLGIIAMFISLIYSIASLLFGVAKVPPFESRVLVLFITIFPVIVFFGFLYLVIRHSKDLYSPRDFKDESNWVKMQVGAALDVMIADNENQNKINDNSDESKQEIYNLAYNIVNNMSDTIFMKLNNKNANIKILWVDDIPSNNVLIRNAFTRLGYSVDNALSTEEGLNLLNNNRYNLIISDMGRKEGPKEGYKLLEKVRGMGISTPYYIYSSSEDPKHVEEAKMRGAQGATNRATKLFEMVNNTIREQLIHKL